MTDEPSNAGGQSSGLIHLGGLLIERRTDILALAAFVLSILGVFAQLREYLRGPDLSLWGPDQVLIYFDHAFGESDDRTFIRLGGRMTYVNEGAPSYADIVRDERVSFRLAERDYTQRAQHVLEYDELGAPIGVKPILPEPVLGGGTVSREVLFASRREKDGDAGRNYLSKSAWQRTIETQKKLHLRFEATTYRGGRFTYECDMNLDDSILETLALKGYAAPTCWPSAAEESGGYSFF